MYAEVREEILEVKVIADSESTEATASMVRHVWEKIIKPELLRRLEGKGETTDV